MMRVSAGIARICSLFGAGMASIFRRWFFFALLAVIAVYYLFLLSNGTFRIFAPEMLDKVFNSMLMHLLRGDFTVDREAIDFEASIRDGKTYTYFGVFPALLRVAAIPFTDVAHAELARLSCLAAAVLFVALQLWALLVVHNSLPIESRRPGLLAVMVAATVLSGPQLYILAAARIYHEPILWSAAMGAAFNLIILRAALGGPGLSRRDLVWLAVLAGLALSTRAPIGVALYLGATLLLLWVAWSRHVHLASGPSLLVRGALLHRASRLVCDPSIVLPILILGFFAVVAGIVNFGRWGNPLQFGGDIQYHYWIRKHPEMVAAIRNYGVFDFGRLWIGALYYATGIPYLLKNVPPFADFLQAHVAGIEAPPVTPILTNPITIVLAALGLYRLCWKLDLPASALAIVRLTLIGHASTVFLMLAFAYFTLRYRFDFAPFMTLAALVGYRSFSIIGSYTSETWRRRSLVTAVAFCIIGILGSHYILLVHKVWAVGVPMEVRRALLPFAPFAHRAFEQ
jgi:hypothetical protein